MINCHPFADMGFNIAWLKGGHPLLNVGDLAMEASQSLGLLLEQLKSPKIRLLSTPMIIVFVTRLPSSICIPVFYFIFVHVRFVSSFEQINFLKDGAVSFLHSFCRKFSGYSPLH